MKKTELDLIRERDADYKKAIPNHWQAQLDRRYLLKLLDEMQEKEDYPEECRHVTHCRCI